VLLHARARSQGDQNDAKIRVFDERLSVVNLSLPSGLPSQRVRLGSQIEFQRRVGERFRLNSDRIAREALPRKADPMQTAAVLTRRASPAISGKSARTIGRCSATDTDRSGG